VTLQRFALALALAVGPGCVGTIPEAEEPPEADAPPAARALPADQVQYKIFTRLLPDAHRLESEATVRIPAAAQAREALTFSLYSGMADLAVEVLSPAACAGPAELQPAGDDVVWSDAFPPNRRWELRPHEPFPRGAEIVLRVSSAGGEAPGFNYYLGPEGCFATTTLWYPSFAPVGVGTLWFAVPADYEVKATGRPMARSGADSGPEALVEYRVEQPSRFSFAAARYVVHRDETEGVPITLYTLRARTFDDDFVRCTRRAVQVLEAEFGPFPREEFAIVETPSPQSEQAAMGGASVEGFMLASSSFLDRGFNLAYFAHEIGHQWWGMSVTREGDEGMFMLDEALAQYGALQAVEQLEGPQKAEQFRLTGYPGFSNTIESGLGALIFASAGLDCALARLGVDCASMANYELSDSKGFMVYHALARHLGADVFRAALRRVSTEHAFRSITWQTFLQDIERSSGQDLSWFYAQWFDRPGVPHLELQWSQAGDALACTIRQSPPLYRLTLPVHVTLESGETVVHEVEVAAETTDVRLSVSGTVTSVELDPQLHVLHSTPELRAKAEALSAWARGDLLWMNGREAEALAVATEALQPLGDADPYGAEFLLRYLLGTIHRDAGRVDDMRREYERALACPVRWEEYVPKIERRLAELPEKPREPAPVQADASER
jgi:hypothetical protein